MLRLDKYLSDATSYSRREVRGLVKRKAVTVNGTVARDVDIKVDETQDTVCVNGTAVVYRKFIYLIPSFRP